MKALGIVRVDRQDLDRESLHRSISIARPAFEGGTARGSPFVSLHRGRRSRPNHSETVPSPGPRPDGSPATPPTDRSPGCFRRRPRLIRPSSTDRRGPWQTDLAAPELPGRPAESSTIFHRTVRHGISPDTSIFDSPSILMVHPSDAAGRRHFQKKNIRAGEHRQPPATCAAANPAQLVTDVRWAPVAVKATATPAITTPSRPSPPHQAGAEQHAALAALGWRRPPRSAPSSPRSGAAGRQRTPAPWSPPAGRRRPRTAGWGCPAAR